MHLGSVRKQALRSSFLPLASVVRMMGSCSCQLHGSSASGASAGMTNREGVCALQL